MRLKSQETLLTIKLNSGFMIRKAAYFSAETDLCAMRPFYEYSTLHIQLIFGELLDSHAP